MSDPPSSLEPIPLVMPGGGQPGKQQLWEPRMNPILFTLAPVIPMWGRMESCAAVAYRRMPDFALHGIKSVRQW